MRYDPHGYEMPFRPNYEMRSMLGWLGGSAADLAIMAGSSLPVGPFAVVTGISFSMAMARLPKALRIRQQHKLLYGTPLEFMKLSEVVKLLEKHQDDIWLGSGYTWENRHIQRCYELIKRDLERDLGKKYKDRRKELAGEPWIHGLESKTMTEFVPVKHFEGHALLVGTTGSGKTRFYDMLITQDIIRRKKIADKKLAKVIANKRGTVVIIDPKGDHELKENARRACEFMGEPDRFLEFHPAFPESSCRINPLHNFTRATELASRVAALLPSEDVFSDFAWNAINNIVQGLVAANDQPSLRKIRHYIEGGTERLVTTVVERYIEEHADPKDAKEWFELYMPDYEKRTPAQIAKFRIRLYRDKVNYGEIKPNSDIEGLFTMFEHDKAHFSKMIASLLPLLNMLTSGEVGEMLSPDSENLDDSRTITNTRKIVEQGKVLYVGLDSLTDTKVASAIGSMLLSDLTAVAGDRYNFDDLENCEFVSVYVDEAAECLNSQLLMLLNKGRGAKFRLMLATQTVPDFIARLGSEEMAMQFLGNMNNTIALRVIDSKTQEYVTENMLPTKIKTVMRTQGNSSDSNEPSMHGGNTGERLIEEEVAPIPQQLLGSLPNLEFIAKVSGGRIYKGKIPILVGEG
ncbi:conjugative transfer system coupling protein TraD [Halomonas sp. I5-271120]|uniref:conjugative transfer system coupling protein TraD n=1 Tax=Halomonas sp. I5-271120 TaxID=3061632 RepID=UPI0027145659|nr:conjugative transfer system coupling protein TraD [Halomonas sp. I5-271120]